MPLTNAERQAAFRARKQKTADECVTPDDVRRGARLIYDQFASDPSNQAAPWEEWLAECRNKKAGGRWSQFIPDPRSAAEYEEDGFSPADAALLAKVGAVSSAMTKPPTED